jgi:hypothetical protein
MKFKQLIEKNAAKRTAITHNTWRSAEPLVRTPPRMIAVVAMEHDRAI